MRTISEMDQKELENLTDREIKEKLCEFYVEGLNQYKCDKFEEGAKIDGKIAFEILEDFDLMKDTDKTYPIYEPDNVAIWTCGELIDHFIFGMPLAIFGIIATIRYWSLTFSVASIFSLTIIAFALLFLFRINDLYNYLFNFDYKVGGGEENLKNFSLKKLCRKFTSSIAITFFLALFFMLGRIVLEIKGPSQTIYIITILLLSLLSIFFFFLTKKPAKPELAKYTYKDAYTYLISYASLKIEEFCACSCTFFGLTIIMSCMIDRTSTYLVIPCAFLIMWTRKKIDYQLLIKSLLLKYQKAVIENGHKIESKVEQTEPLKFTDEEIIKNYYDFYIEDLNQYKCDKFDKDAKINGEVVYKILKPFGLEKIIKKIYLKLKPNIIPIWTFGEYFFLYAGAVGIILPACAVSHRYWTLTFSTSSIFLLTFFAFGLLFLFRINDVYNHLLNINCKIGGEKERLDENSLKKIAQQFTSSFIVTICLTILLLILMMISISKGSAVMYLITVAILSFISLMFFYLTKKPDPTKYTEDDAYIYLICYSSLRIERFCTYSCMLWGFPILTGFMIGTTNFYLAFPCIFLILWFRKKIDYQLLIKSLLLKYQQNTTSTSRGS